MLEEKEPDCHSILLLLGCLPAGLKKSHFKSLIQSLTKVQDEVVEKSLEILDTLSFLDTNSIDTVCANKYMINFLMKEIDDHLLKTYMVVICISYIDQLKKTFEISSTLEEHNNPKNEASHPF